MTINTLRSRASDINWGRVLMALALVAVFGVMFAEPAFAFSEFQNKVTSQTGSAARVIRTILFTGAVVSLLVGAAPMLWGQVKVKWLVTGMAACVVFTIIGAVVTAFSGAAPKDYTDGTTGA